MGAAASSVGAAGTSQQLLFIGMGLGLAVAIQPGPMSVWLLRSTLAGGIAVGAAIGAGIVLVDAAYAVLGAAGAGAVLAIDGVEAAAGLLGALVVAALGALTLRSARTVGDAQPARELATSPRRAFAISVLATLANPTTIASLAAAFTLIGASYELDEPSNVAHLVLGVAIGSAAWFTVLVVVSALVGERVGRRTLQVIDVVSGVALIAFAIALGVRVLST